MELVLNVEHSGSQTTFLDLNITISNRKISTKLYYKRDDFLFFIVRLPNFHSNILSSVFYGIVRDPSDWEIFFFSALITRMEKQGGNRENL